MKNKIQKAWALLENGQPCFPLFHTKKEALKKRFVEDLARIEIRIIKIEKL